MPLFRHPMIDLLRVFAAFLIAGYHFALFASEDKSLFPGLTESHPFMQFIVTAVLIFLVVTAIVIPMHLEYNRYQPKDYPVFLLKRFIRVHVPFLTVVFLIIAVEQFFLWKKGMLFHIDWSQFWSNITLSAEFTGKPWYNTIFWTLAIEIQFYVFVGLLFPLLERFGIRTLLLFFIAGETLHWVVGDSRFFWNFTPFFSLGFAIWLLLKERMSKSQFLVFLTIAASTTGFLHEAWSLWLFPLFGFLFLIELPVPKRIAGWGQYTYSFYLIHGLIGGNLLYFTRNWNPDLPTAILRFSLALACSFIGAWAFFRLLEKPSIRWTRIIPYRKERTFS